MKLFYFFVTATISLVRGCPYRERFTMYRPFYNLQSKPFQISADPNFMWLGEKHEEALATLKYGILDNKGFLLLTGDVGTGKTTLINALTNSLDNDVIYASVPDPSLEREDFFNYVGSAFGIGDKFASKGGFLAAFSRFLHQAHEEKKKVLLIIDEAQLLTQELLEEIRLLSNIERTDTKLLNIFFIGQPEINEVLNKEKNRAVRQRLTLHYAIEPLTEDETGKYIQYRLEVAGSGNRIFTPSAVREIYYFSEGFPRRINIICDHCLLTGYSENKEIIDEAMVQECAEELTLPRNTGKIRPFTFPQAQTIIPPESLPQAHSQDTVSGYGRFIVKSSFAVALILLSLFYGDILIQQLLQSSHSLSSRNTFTEKKVQLVQNKPPTMLPGKMLPSVHAGTTEHTQPALQKNKQIQKEMLTTPTPVAKSNDPHANTLVRTKTEIPAIPIKPLIIHFQFNSNEFEKGELRKMDNFAQVLAFQPKTKIFVKGYSDSSGQKSYNRILSTFRANLVKSYLLGKGAKPEQIQVEGFGSQNPLESNESPWGRSKNRRVEIEIINPM